MILIDVSVLKEWVENWFTKNRLYHPYAKNNNIPITELYDILEQMPTIEDLSAFCDKLWRGAYERGKEEGKAERKTGKWIELDCDEDKYDVIKCPCCKHTFTVDSYHWTDIGFVKDDFKFCPNCGAEMSEEVGNE